MSKIDPVKPAEFQLAEHRFRRFDCFVPAGLKNKDLEDPALWVHVAPQMKQFDEVRAIAEDHSFVAYLMVMFSQGSDARLKIVNGADLDDVTEIESSNERYKVQLRGVKKYVLYDANTSEIIKENIPTKAKAYKELEDYVLALRS